MISIKQYETLEDFIELAEDTITAEHISTLKMVHFRNKKMAKKLLSRGEYRKYRKSSVVQKIEKRLQENENDYTA